MQKNIEICLIAAVSQNGIIGINNQLPWHLPEDLKHFKALTMGYPIIMGRKTFQSLPKHLIDRYNIVLSRQKSININGYQSNKKKIIINTNDKNKEIIGELSNSVEEAISIAKNSPLVTSLFDIQNEHPSLMVIGGTQIYQLFLEFADKLYITKIEDEYKGDAYFPNWENINQNFNIINSNTNINPQGLIYTFQEYNRK